jgi:2-polyprenyl-3-methyl-5-hydroxy-6-metoxy-1,4-benzoquinol methylase
LAGLFSIPFPPGFFCAEVWYLRLATLPLLIAFVALLACSDESSMEGERRASMDAAAFEEFVRDVFMPIYPILAEQIISDTMISDGFCLDVGAGGGHLSIELARMSTMTIECTDIDPEAVAIARGNVADAGLDGRITCSVADVQDLPY